MNIEPNEKIPKIIKCFYVRLSKVKILLAVIICCLLAFKILSVGINELLLAMSIVSLIMRYSMRAFSGKEIEVFSGYKVAVGKVAFSGMSIVFGYFV